MFKTTGTVISDTILDAVSKAERDYIIKKDDYLDLLVYTNNGERLVDPNQEMGKQLGTNTGLNNSLQHTQVKYLVENSGQVKLPMIGYIHVQGYSLRQLDSVLQQKYSEYYEGAFVVAKILNKRVFVLGNTGNKIETSGKVIPLENENMSVIEVLALAGGMDQYAKSSKIRLIRGDLSRPNVYLIDLSTIEGVRRSHMNVQPNDIIYVERQRRILSQILTEVGPLVMVLNTILLIYIATRTRL